MRSNSDVEFAIAVHVAECHLVWSVCKGCGAEGRAELAIAFTFEDRNRTSTRAGYDEIELLIVVHVADQNIVRPALHRQWRTAGAG